MLRPTHSSRECIRPLIIKFDSNNSNELIFGYMNIGIQASSMLHELQSQPTALIHQLKKPSEWTFFSTACHHPLGKAETNKARAGHRKHQQRNKNYSNMNIMPEISFYLLYPLWNIASNANTNFSHLLKDPTQSPSCMPI